jgi:hypothetical protein
LDALIEEVPLAIRREMWFMHDGAPAHFNLLVRHYLNRRFPLRWIGRGGPTAWPARSQDLNPLDYYLWGHLKSVVYETPVPDIVELRRRLTQGCEDIKATNEVFERIRRSLLRRAETCVEIDRSHFEQYL